ncbi:hypothetical protein GE061_016211 [Apolygus lucorum]|uniref:Retrotransposon gag domain-containing protein n=1 Tax=Apolygus lucorum TaxID=248454 RepID=A0A8S9XFL4_APOLU|nr:hypothetical protein GE061_016211 [Apolygus lucorum]
MVLFQHLLDQQHNCNVELVRKTMEAMSVMAREIQMVSKPCNMNVPEFDGCNEDPRIWLTLYEKACEVNNWKTDGLKINCMVSHFVTGSTAHKWFCSRILEDESDDWISWKSSFLCAFGQNPVHLAQNANDFIYKHGTLMNYYYEKSRLVQLAYGQLTARAFNILMLMGLPEEMQDQLIMVDCTSKEPLRKAMEKLMPRMRTNEPADLSRTTRKAEPASTDQVAEKKLSWRAKTSMRGEDEDEEGEDEEAKRTKE